MLALLAECKRGAEAIHSWFLLAHHGVGDGPYFVDFACHDVARFQVQRRGAEATNPWWCAGQNEIASFQSHKLRDELDEMVGLEY